MLCISQRAQVRITVLSANTPCLPFLRKRSPDGATPNWSRRHPITAYYSSIDSASALSWTRTTVADGHKFSAVRRLSRRLLVRSKNAIFTHPTWIWRPRWGWSHRNFVDIFCWIKLESMGHRAALSVVLCSVVLVQLRFVTDRETDGRTDGHAMTPNTAPV